MALFLSQRWNRQPSGSTQLSPNSNATNGLVFACLPGQSGMQYPNGQMPTRNTGFSVVPTTAGMAMNLSAVASAGLQYGVLQPIPANSNAFSLLGIGSTVGSRGAFYTQVYGVSPYPTVEFGINVNTGGTYTPNAFTYYFLDYNGVVLSGAASTAFNDGKMHVVIGVRPAATAAQIYVDGVNATASTAGALTTNSGSALQQVCVGNAAMYTPTDRIYLAPISLVVVWNRVLSAGEISSISQNPWQLFAPIKPVIYNFPSLRVGGRL